MQECSKVEPRQTTSPMWGILNFATRSVRTTRNLTILFLDFFFLCLFPLLHPRIVARRHMSATFYKKNLIFFLLLVTWHAQRIIKGEKFFFVKPQWKKNGYIIWQGNENGNIINNMGGIIWIGALYQQKRGKPIKGDLG